MSLPIVLLLAALTTAAAAGPARIDVTNPKDGAVFPRDFAPPTFRWADRSGADEWQVQVVEPKAGRTPADSRGSSITARVSTPSWQPTADEWTEIRTSSLERDIRFEVVGLLGRVKVSEGGTRFRTSHDPVGAPIFFREVPLPIAMAQMRKETIRWRLGDVSSTEEPRTLLSGVRTCANCHSFSADGRTLALDVDYGSDSGSYAVVDVAAEISVGPGDLITWRDFEREDGHPTLGLLSRISPDGRHVASTVDEVTIMHMTPDLWCSQLFFPIRGILAVWERASRRFFSLPGANDPAFVQTNPEWSPDGRFVVFARARAVDYCAATEAERSRATAIVAEPFASGRESIHYDLYRVPFNDGAGGEPEPLVGASDNGRSNYFARHSPDGKWIVFCQAGGFMFNRPDSELFIVPAGGGVARRLAGNTPGRMSSWHSWSPNGRWLVYSSKADGPYTQLRLTHIDEAGRDSPPVLLERFATPERAANLPEFVNTPAERFGDILLEKGIREGLERGLPFPR